MRLDYVDKPKNSSNRDITPKRVAFTNKDHLKTQNKRKQSKKIGKENFENPAYDYGHLKSNTEKKRAKIRDRQKRERKIELDEEEEENPFFNEEGYNQSQSIDQESDEQSFESQNSDFTSNQSEASFTQNMSQQYHLKSIASTKGNQAEYHQDPNLIKRRIMMPPQTPLSSSNPNRNYYQNNVPEPPKTPYNQYQQASFVLPGETPSRQVNPPHQNFTPYNYGYQVPPPQPQESFHNAPPHPHHPHFQHSYYDRANNNYGHPAPAREIFPPQTPVNYHLPRESMAPITPQQFFYPHQDPRNQIYQTQSSMGNLHQYEDVHQGISARSKLKKMREKMKKKIKNLKKKKKKRYRPDSSSSEDLDNDYESESESEYDSSYEHRREEYLRKKRKRRKKMKGKSKRKIKNHDQVYKETLERIENLRRVSDFELKESRSFRAEYQKSSYKIRKPEVHEEKRESLIPFNNGNDTNLAQPSASSMIEKFKRNLEKLHSQTEDPLTSESTRIETRKFMQESNNIISKSEVVLCEYNQRRSQHPKQRRRSMKRNNSVKIPEIPQVKSVLKNSDGKIKASSRYSSREKIPVPQQKSIENSLQKSGVKKAPVRMEFDFSNDANQVEKRANSKSHTFEIPLGNSSGLDGPKTLAEAFKHKKQSMVERLKSKKIKKKEKREITFDKYELFQKRKQMKMSKPRSVSKVKKKEEKVEMKSKSPIKLPPSHIMERLAKGGKSKLSKKEMYEVNKRMRNKLPEVKQKENAKKKREEFMKRQARLKAFNKVCIFI